MSEVLTKEQDERSSYNLYVMTRKQELAEAEWESFDDEQKANFEDFDTMKERFWDDEACTMNVMTFSEWQKHPDGPPQDTFFLNAERDKRLDEIVRRFIVGVMEDESANAEIDRMVWENHFDDYFEELGVTTEEDIKNVAKVIQGKYNDLIKPIEKFLETYDNE